MQGLFYLFDTTLLLVKMQSFFLGDHFLYNIPFAQIEKKTKKHLSYLWSLFCDRKLALMIYLIYLNILTANVKLTIYIGIYYLSPHYLATKAFYSHRQTKTTNLISQQLIIFFVIWLQILAGLAEICWKTCLPSFSHKLFRAAIFLAYKYSPNSGSWATKFTSKWLMMKLNCWKWSVWQQWCPWLPISNNFSGKTLPLRFKGFQKALSRPLLPINFYFRPFFLNLFS